MFYCDSLTVRCNLLELKIRSVQKDSLNALKNFQIKLDDDQFVILKDVVYFNTIKSFEKIIKDSGEKNFYIYANVDSKKITATETLVKIDYILEEAKNDGFLPRTSLSLYPCGFPWSPAPVVTPWFVPWVSEDVLPV